MPSQEPSDSDWIDRRRQMIRQQIRDRGIRDKRTLEAMMSVPRERFVPASLSDAAYEDRALPISHCQTISQPYIVAYMTEQLAPTADDRILEIGTGTGYQTAILALLGKHVYSVERLRPLRESAAANLACLGLTNVTLTVGDGSLGLESAGPFDRILVTAAAPRVPTPLLDQLTDGGVLVAPVGRADEQTLVRVVRHGSRTVETPLLACRFVKLIGHEGWKTRG